MGKRMFEATYAFVACLLTVVAFGFALWASHQAITYGLAPPLGYIALAGLALVGVNLAVSLLRHAIKVLRTGETS